MEKLDLTKQLKPLYGGKPGQFLLVDVPPLNALMIDGTGDPNTSPAYADAITALYAVSYTLKFMGKAATPPVDWKVMPLEGLWWADDMADFASGRKDRWHWTMLIVQPDAVTPEMVAAAKEKAAAKVPAKSLAALRLDTLREGRAGQVLYVGPWASEGPVIADLHRFIGEQGGTLSGKHHEIYLSDPRRVAPEKLKTIIRQPMA